MNCLNFPCSEPAAPKSRFCSPDCAKAWAAARLHEKQVGKPVNRALGRVERVHINRQIGRQNWE